jgi:hypothetical protein
MEFKELEVGGSIPLDYLEMKVGDIPHSRWDCFG